MSSSVFRVQEHKIPGSHIREYPNALANDQEEVVHLAVKQYTPLDNTSTNGRSITIVGAHANAFPKELYEPLWDELYSRLGSKGITVRNIFIADVAHQGQSGVINEQKLGNDPSWMDHARDLFLMINHFRSEMKRPLVGIGHSMGGAQLVNLAYMHPRLLSSLILIDPVILRVQSMDGNFGPARASTKRRDKWPSRKEAEAGFKRSKFYQAWDARVLDLWLKYGLRDTPTPLYPAAGSSPSHPQTAKADSNGSTDAEVTLTTTKHQEVFTFQRANWPTESHPYPNTDPNPTTHPDIDPTSSPNAPFYRGEPIATFKRLPTLRPTVQYIFGEESPLSAPILCADKMAVTGVGVGGSGGARKGRVRQVTVKGAGHLIPMEKVEETAGHCVDWLVPEMGRWWEQEVALAREWSQVPKERKAVMSEEFVEMMKKDWSKMDFDRPEKKDSKL
ncbi:hypothetical protein MBLNU230_g6603t1 [Neophaeotheca triangularis]